MQKIIRGENNTRLLIFRFETTSHPFHSQNNQQINRLNITPKSVRDNLSMVGVAQVVEHRVVAPVVEGSSPFTHPILNTAPVAQLDRAPDFESVGRRFESCRAYQ